MSRPLDGVQAKLERAWQNMDAFDKAFKSALAADPIQLGLKPDPQPGYHVYKVKYVPELPPILSVILGDICHDLRSALDHTVWQLALLTTPKPFRNTSYPIVEKARDFPAQCFRIADLKPAHQAMIEARQPYHRINTLGVLSTLVNRDKHRELNAVLVRSMFFGEGPTFYGLEGCKVESTEWLTDGLALEVNAEIARLKLINCTGEPKVRVDGHLVPDIQLREGRAEDLTDSLPSLLLRLGSDVRLIVQEFEGILEPRPPFAHLFGKPGRRWPAFAFWPPTPPRR